MFFYRVVSVQEVASFPVEIFVAAVGQQLFVDVCGLDRGDHHLEALELIFLNRSLGRFL
jgi:hypothetical protein